MPFLSFFHLLTHLVRGAIFIFPLYRIVERPEASLLTNQITPKLELICIQSLSV